VSSKLGAGTRFEISWPEAPAKVGRSAAVASARRSNTLAPGAGTIIVVEDEPQVRALIVRTLERAGYSVLEAADGDAALDLVQGTADNCRALCVDGVIPGATSSDVIEAFTRRYPTSPVLLISGHLPSSLEERGLLAQSATLLPKPFEPQRLCELLAQRLSVEGVA
jgi:CheY-like chemotaxis protein